MMKKTIIASALILNALIAGAQHEHHDKTDTTKKTRAKPTPALHHHQPPHAQHDTFSMSHAFSLNLPMNRNGSGTAWLPDNSPMYGKMIHSKKWMYMLHGNLFLRYNKQDITKKGNRGDEQFDAPNWIMFMGQRKVGRKGLFHFSSMFSLDAAVTGKKGYPLLFQTGETANGKPLIDRQHPHDLFSELSISYAHAFNKDVDAFLYLGYPGEPAIGPVAFMHRPSALDNPNAPLSHHWTDATHITFGVATAGIRVGMFKIEGSSFTGREPDEDRYNFDKARFDSWSGRVSFNPSRSWAFQYSYGAINSPEALHPEEDITRSTASVIYSNRINGDNLLDATLLWGANKANDHQAEHALLAEARWRKQKLAVYTRYEFVEKSTHELDLDESTFGPDNLFAVHALTAGINYDIVRVSNTPLAIGTQWTVYRADKNLDQLYGKNPMSFQVYLRLYPSLMMQPR